MKRIALLATAIALVSSPAHADNGPWQWELTPYVWMAGLNGDLAIGNLEVPVEVSFGDILDDLEIGFIGHVEAHNDQWSIFSDLVYLELGRGANNLDFDLTEVIIEAGAGYRLSANFEIIGGIRWWNIDAMAARTVDPKLERAADKDWVEPIIGARFRVPMSERFTLGLRGDVGGFGAGSEFSWSAAGFVDFKVTEGISILAGYKGLGVDYKDEADEDSRFFNYDMITHGPALAATFRF